MDELFLVIMAIGLPIASFFVFREIVLRYFRINRIVELLEKIEDNTNPSGPRPTLEQYMGDAEQSQASSKQIFPRR